MESTFQTKVQSSRRVVIPTPVFKALSLKPGDSVLVVIRKAEEAET